jgi:sugar phosphate isomerase/epimerase
MHAIKYSRRQALKRTSVALGAAWLGTGLFRSAATHAAAHANPSGGFVFCLNTSTIRGQKLSLLKEVEIAAQVGYQAIEPWVEAIDKHAQDGGSLKDLRKRISDLGLTVESAIGFPEWMVDDEARRARGLERAKRDMDLVAQIGGKRLAAPPAGANNAPVLDLTQVAARYHTLLKLGDSIGVTPQLEIWGASKNLSRLSQALFVAAETGHPKACLLADVFHLYKGGSDFKSLRLVHGEAMPVFHLNDYPNDPPREKITDGSRVMPGDGVAPLDQILQDLKATGGQKVLSLELFSRSYWERDALAVAKEGLAKMKAAVARVG